MCVCMYMHICPSMYINKHICMYVYVCICTYGMCVCMYMHICPERAKRKMIWHACILSNNNAAFFFLMTISTGEYKIEFFYDDLTCVYTKQQ